VLLVHTKLCETKLGSFGKKLKNHFFLLFCSKKNPKTVFWKKHENEVFSK
jgi:hypothetical protein